MQAFIYLFIYIFLKSVHNSQYSKSLRKEETQPRDTGNPLTAEPVSI